MHSNSAVKEEQQQPLAHDLSISNEKREYFRSLLNRRLQVPLEEQPPKGHFLSASSRLWDRAKFPLQLDLQL